MFSVAIDGPSGTGKSTVAKLLANKLNKIIDTIYLDTGAIYRTVAYYLITNISDRDIENEDMVSQICEDLCIEVKYKDGVQHVYVNGDDVTDYIRTERVSKVTSLIASYKNVRASLLNIQREIARKNNVVMDGRDIGSKVLPDATLKIYLDADINIRAKRRYEQLKSDNSKIDFDEVLKDLKIRDEADINREVSPLVKTKDNIYIDTTNMNIDEVVNKLEDLLLNKING